MGGRVPERRAKGGGAPVHRLGLGSARLGSTRQLPRSRPSAHAGPVAHVGRGRESGEAASGPAGMVGGANPARQQVAQTRAWDVTDVTGF